MRLYVFHKLSNSFSSGFKKSRSCSRENKGIHLFCIETKYHYIHHHFWESIQREKLLEPHPQLLLGGKIFLEISLAGGRISAVGKSYLAHFCHEN